MTPSMNDRCRNAIENVKSTMRGCVQTTHIMIREWAALELNAIDGGNATPRQVESVHRAVVKWARARGVVVL